MKALFEAIFVVWIVLWAVMVTIILAVPIIVAGLLSRTGNLAFSLSKFWAYTMLAFSFVRTEIKGNEKMNPGTSYIIISNHQSLYDIIALVTTLGIQYRWFIKNVQELIDKTREAVLANFDPNYTGNKLQ